MQRMDKLLGNDNIINATPAWNKSSLKRRNQVAKERSNAGHNGFSNNLIDRVAKANGPKLTKGFKTRALGDQRDKSPVKIMGHFAIVENMRLLSQPNHSQCANIVEKTPGEAHQGQRP